MNQDELNNIQNGFNGEVTSSNNVPPETMNMDENLNQYNSGLVAQPIFSGTQNSVTNNSVQSEIPVNEKIIPTNIEGYVQSEGSQPSYTEMGVQGVMDDMNSMITSSVQPDNMNMVGGDVHFNNAEISIQNEVSQSSFTEMQEPTGSPNSMVDNLNQMMNQDTPVEQGQYGETQQSYTEMQEPTGSLNSMVDNPNQMMNQNIPVDQGQYGETQQSYAEMPNGGAMGGLNSNNFTVPAQNIGNQEPYTGELGQQALNQSLDFTSTVNNNVRNSNYGVHNSSPQNQPVTKDSIVFMVVFGIIMIIVVAILPYIATI